MDIPEKTCRFYLTDLNGSLIHTHDDGGICILRELFSDCSGLCDEYEKEDE